MNITVTDAIGHETVLRELFTEYINMLLSNDSSFAEYLKIQHYDDELVHPERKYGRPEGRLYLLYADGKPAGCVALRKLDEERCEMKRLYVREEYRGRHLGKLLTERIISDAKEIGYRSLYLDTLPFLTTAIRMYEEIGFQYIPSYNDSPLDDTVFMKLDL